MPTLEECKMTLLELSEKVGASPQDVWGVLAGGVTRDISLAEALADEMGVSAMTLMHMKSRTRRTGVLQWISFHTQQNKNHILRILSRSHDLTAGVDLARALETFSGIPAPDWRKPTPQTNWMIKWEQ